MSNGGNNEKRVGVRRYLYHFSNPYNREFILKHGLQARGKTDAWLDDTPIDGKVIFFSNTNKKQALYYTGYNDDLYRVDTTQLDIEFFIDPNQESENYVYIRGDIGVEHLELIYKGDGKTWMMFEI